MKSEEYLDLEKKLRHREQMERYSREKELDRQQQRMHMNKIEQLHEDQRRRERNNSPEQKKQDKIDINVLLILLALILVFLMALFVISPGALIVIHTFDQLKQGGNYIEYWAYSSVTSLLIFTLIFFITKNTKKSLVAYTVLCICATALAYNSDFQGTNGVDHALKKFWPFNGSDEQQYVAVQEPLDASPAPEQKLDKNANKLAGTPTPSEILETSPQVTHNNNQTSAQADISSGAHPELSDANPSNSKSLSKSISSNTEETSTLSNQSGSGVIDSNTEQTSVIKASFDCSKAKLPVEFIICSDQLLADLDLRLNEVYKAKLLTTDSKERLKSTQLDWIKNEARPCRDKRCVEVAYKNRINQLLVDK